MRRGPPDDDRPDDGHADHAGDATPTQVWRSNVSGPIKGGVIAGRYRLEELMAKGGMGSVWRGTDQARRRQVAVKFMDPAIACNEVLRKRFDREAKSAGKLNTPFVVEIYEHGVAEDVPYIVMEMLEGEDLQRRTRRERRLPLRETAEIARHIALGLTAAHAAGIIHRDLKPQNIFLSVHQDLVTAKILDFGVAKVLGPVEAGEGTKTGVVLGSPHYMSPEQARGLSTFDHRSDLWSFGVILYKLVTGHRPFKGEAAGDIIVKICAEPVPIPSTFRRNLVPEIDAFFARALERSPDKRFQTALEMFVAFEASIEAQLRQALPRTAAVQERPSTESAAPTPISSEHRTPLSSDGAGAPDAASHPSNSAPGAPPAWVGTVNVDLRTPITGASEPTGASASTGHTVPTTHTAPTGSLRPSELLSVDPEDQVRGTRNMALVGGLVAAGALVLLMLVFAVTADPVKKPDAAPPSTPATRTDESATPSAEIPPELPPSDPRAASQQLVPEPSADASATIDPTGVKRKKGKDPKRPRPAPKQKDNEDWGY